MKKHNLYEINLERKTAFCTICGYTQIHVAKMRKRTNPQVMCVYRAKELQLDRKAKYRHLREGTSQENSKSSPSVTEIDQAFNEIYIPVEDNRKLIYEFILGKKCKRCGVWALDPAGFKFFEMHLPREQKLSTLVRTTTTECLRLELEKRDLYCKKCIWLIAREFTYKIPVPPVKPFNVI